MNQIQAKSLENTEKGIHFKPLGFQGVQKWIPKEKLIYEETTLHTAMKFSMKLEEICRNHIKDLS